MAEVTPCLEAWYDPRFGPPTRPPIDEQLTIAPFPCLSIWRSSNFMQLQTPRRLIEITRSKSSLVNSAASTATFWTPALL